MPIQDFKTGFNGQLSAAEIRRLQEAVEALGRMNTVLGNGLTIQGGSSGMYLEDTRPQGFFAAITGRSGTAYAWTEKRSDGAGGWATANDPRSGTTTSWPAYDGNGSTAVDASGSTVVWMIPSGNGDNYLFWSVSGSGSFIVEDIDSSPTVANVSTLRFDSADGFVVSSVSSGIARVDMQAASATQTGVVNLTSGQVLGDGDKYLQDRVFVNTTSVPSWVSYHELIVDGQIGCVRILDLFEAGGGNSTSINHQSTALSIQHHNGTALGYTSAIIHPAGYNGFTNAGMYLVELANVGTSPCYGVWDNGAYQGKTGTSGGGDTVKGGIITTLGSGPSTDFGTW